MRISARTLTVAGTTAAALAVTALVATPAVAATTLTAGHVDVVDSEWDGSALHLHVHDEETDTEYEPSDVVLSVPAAARVANPGYAFLGSGSQVWLLPEDQALADARGVLFAGFSTEALEPGVFAGDSVSYSLVDATLDGAGTDAFSVYVGSGTRWYDSNTATSSYKTKAFPVGAHNHATWAFEEAGTYELTFRVSGTVAGAAKTATETYTVVVGS
ncbi:choice-of-anchor M domain-containing protein [Streptomyces sp. NRRL WC-3549]|uniref:choice-of-anchor M domain-containing protein n=1 Tax=Streptomyces sp. NRRL WC-3549 TaxID=1463925 RepID=UPI00068F13EE|nr:choice-of-anchor M domain-containing protein [Streptomyces sp. NRRL WC-3549]